MYFHCTKPLQFSEGTLRSGTAQQSIRAQLLKNTVQLFKLYYTDNKNPLSVDEWKFYWTGLVWDQGQSHKVSNSAFQVGVQIAVI